MASEAWDASQPLRAGASDEQVEERFERLRWHPSYREAARLVARELVAAETAALREKLSRVTAERDALAPLARLGEKVLALLHSVGASHGE